MLDKIKKNAEEAKQTFGYRLSNGLLTIADEEEACKDPYWAYRFALHIERANIEKCQEAACKDPEYAYTFAYYVKGANIEKCQEAAGKDPEWAYYFAEYILGANIERCREVCKGTEYEF